MQVIDWTIDIVFFLDIVLNFNTGFCEKPFLEKRENLENLFWKSLLVPGKGKVNNVRFYARVNKRMQLVMQRRPIAMHYLASWFAIDFLSVIPFNNLFQGGKFLPLFKLSACF